MRDHRIDWRSQRVLVTGGNGFLGTHLIAALRKAGCGQVHAPRSIDFDLTGGAATQRVFSLVRPTVVFHLAARVGGIEANRRNPGRFFRDNLVMGINVLDEVRDTGVPRTVLVGTTCSYPRDAPIPLRESDLWSGYPEATNAPYGIAKRALVEQAAAYRRQYGTQIACVLPANLYGPGDNFDLEMSHVIPALVRKFSEAADGEAPEVEVWGDGSATREFLYVEDCAEALMLAAGRCDIPEPINLGTGVEISIVDLAREVGLATGFKGEVRFNPTRPSGQPRRCLDVTRAKEELGFEAKTVLRDGLRKTVEWWRYIRGGNPPAVRGDK